MYNNDPDNTLEKQILLINRLYAKIDYHKAARIRVPSYVAIANFGLLALSTRSVESESSAVIFSLGFLCVGCVGFCALLVVQMEYQKFIRQLDYLYDVIKVKSDQFHDSKTKSLADQASPLWILLFCLIGISVGLPLMLTLFVEFLPLGPRI